MSDIECPYCGQESEIDYGDGHGYEESILHETDCSMCEKTFVFTTSIIFHHESYRADCLNGSDHKWKRSITIPINCTKMNCEDCDESRQLTEKEWIDLEKDKGEKITGGYRGDYSNA